MHRGNLDQQALPEFNNISLDEVVEEIDGQLSTARQVVEQVTKGKVSWHDTIVPLEQINEAMGLSWSPVSHLNAVKNRSDWREPYQQTVLKLTEFHTEVGQNKLLYLQYKQLAQEGDSLDAVQKQVLKHAIRDFELSGVALDDDKKTRLQKISMSLTECSVKFDNHLLDATTAWSHHTEQVDVWDGLPEDLIAQAKAKAQSEEKGGCLFDLAQPTYLAVQTYAHNRELRELFYRAYSTRASDQSETTPELDNSDLMVKTVQLRQELVEIIGLESYAHYSLATKMVEAPDDVERFLLDLAKRARSKAEQEWAELQAYAKGHLNIGHIEAWDMAYVSEQMKQARFSFSQEDLRPYFSLSKVQAGMFACVKALYGIEIEADPSVSVWHPDVVFYRLKDEQGELIGGFYADVFAREGKRSGAWMDEYRVRWIKPDGEIQTPIAYLTCNFMPPAQGKPALLDHDEVLTLFHEFGHSLHHLLTQVDYPEVSGINGVEWDAVELPSQFMENFCWSREVLPMLSGHYETDAPLPESLLKPLLESQTYLSGLALLRQVELSLFDFRLHRLTQLEGIDQLRGVLTAVRDEVALIKPPEFNRFENSFLHIFSGGYAAGYYSYKWAEVLSCDVFSMFEEHGLLSREIGERFRTHILARGGSASAAELFEGFRGRGPKIDALLKHCGI